MFGWHRIAFEDLPMVIFNLRLKIPADQFFHILFSVKFFVKHKPIKPIFRIRHHLENSQKLPLKTIFM